MTKHDQQIKRIKKSITQVGLNADKALTSNVCMPSSIKKIEDWFWKFEIGADTPIEYDYDNYRLLHKYAAGGCTSCRIGNWHLRNLDWYINKDVDGLIHTLPNEDRYESWGMFSSSDGFREEILNGAGTGELIVENNALRTTLNILVDGVNEKGVSINTNVVHHMGRHMTPETGTNPGKNDLVSMLICRYVLDHCATVDEAIDKLTNEVNIFFPSIGGYEQHWMICDATKTIIFELDPRDGSLSFIEIGPGKKYPAVMTNFHLTGTELINGHMERTNANNTASPSHIQDFGDGVERYNIMVDVLDSTISSPSDAYDVIAHTLYKQCYTDPNNKWYTECVKEGHPVYAPASDLGAILANEQAEYAAKGKGARTYYYTEDAKTSPAAWSTTHTSLFDLTPNANHMYVKVGADTEAGHQLYTVK